MATEQKKKKDNEISFVLVACGIFGIALLIVDFTYGNMGALLSSGLKWPFYLLHSAVIGLWVAMIALINNPNADVLRKWLIAATIATLLLVLGHRAGFLGNRMFEDDVEKNKQEQISNDN